MKLIKPFYKILPQASGLEGVFKQIESCGKVCYKSEHTIGEDTYKKFFNMIKDKGHLSVLEHGTIYLTIKHNYQNGIDVNDPYNISLDFVLNQYTKTKTDYDNHITYITTNLRVLIERYPDDWENIIKEYMTEPTEHHHKRVTVKFICSRSTSHQIVRHRVFSFSQESQRYCNYSLSKFNNEITFVYPSWLEEFDEQKTLDESPWPDFTYGLLYAEQRYFELLELGLKPQQARQILPNACKTELIVTGFIDDWNQMFNLRCAAGADPDIKEIMIPLKEELCQE